MLLATPRASHACMARSRSSPPARPDLRCATAPGTSAQALLRQRCGRSSPGPAWSTWGPLCASWQHPGPGRACPEAWRTGGTWRSSPSCPGSPTGSTATASGAQHCRAPSPRSPSAPRTCYGGGSPARRRCSRSSRRSSWASASPGCQCWPQLGASAGSPGWPAGSPRRPMPGSRGPPARKRGASLWSGVPRRQPGTTSSSCRGAWSSACCRSPPCAPCGRRTSVLPWSVQAAPTWSCTSTSQLQRCKARRTQSCCSTGSRPASGRHASSSRPSGCACRSCSPPGASLLLFGTAVLSTIGATCPSCRGRLTHVEPWSSGRSGAQDPAVATASRKPRLAPVGRS
mmetsp:Transcript_56181/g.180325  ORF Transcript_56181/g.180325 Transcript_56181/m.180325 type:complete len:343 (-) Transcript_56181:1254-2282(-)